jgi:DNA-binding NarL/FixJ family response regulator
MSLSLADWAGEENLEIRNGERPRTAVVVDEDASWIEAVEQLLDRLGIAMVGATESPDNALDLVVEREPDVLIVGVNEGVAEDASRACLRAARERFPSLTTIGLASSNLVAPLDVPDTVEWENDVSLDEADLGELPEQSESSKGRRPSRPTVSVVIPTLNEAENLPLVLPQLGPDIHEVIVVDGGSDDGTLEVARRLYPGVRAITQAGRGKGDALRTGFAVASGDIIVMLDADGSTDPGEIPAFVGALQGGADFAKGSRFIQGAGTADMTMHRRFGNWVFVVTVRLLFGGRYSDLCYGYNAFWRDVLPALDLTCDGFEIETFMNIRALRARLKVVEVASFEHDRIHGLSKLRAWSDGWRVLKAILRERARRARVDEQERPEEDFDLVTGPGGLG